MSLRPTERNHRAVGMAYSCADWARAAIGGDKVSGEEGFSRYVSSAGWYHQQHYKHIGMNPSLSHPDALEEMSQVRQALVEDLMHNAERVDALVKRLQRMEEEMASVAAFAKELAEAEAEPT